MMALRWPDSFVRALRWPDSFVRSLIRLLVYGMRRYEGLTLPKRGIRADEL